MKLLISSIILLMIFLPNLKGIKSHEYEDKRNKDYNMHKEIPVNCYEDGSSSLEPMCKG